MKKLMIAAASAAMVSGVFAGDCAPDAQGTCASVYTFKMTVKTTKGLTLSGTAAATCTPAGDCAIVREKDSTVIQGLIYDCTCPCDGIKSGSVLAWDSKRKAQITDPSFTTTFLNVMGKKQTLGEWAWSFTGTAAYDGTTSQDAARDQAYALTGAGYGVFNKAKKLFTSFSGNFAGTAGASYDLKSKATTATADCVCDPSQIWDCTDLTVLEDESTVAFGTWTAKYDATASKKYLANGTLTYPSYVTVDDGNGD